MRQLFLMTFVVFVFLSSCQKQAGDSPENPNAGITLQLVIPQSSIVQTKVQSSAETTLTNLWLFTFNASGVLENKCLATGLDNTTHTAKVSVPKGTGLNLYACANVPAAQQSMFNAFQDGVTTLAELKAITTPRSALTAPGLPMWGELTGQTILPTTTTITLSLVRICSINITGVRAPGFATLAEAGANSPQNVDYSVTATDGDATDRVTSNGQYYLGVSNSAFVTYTDAGMTGVTLSTVTHNAPSSITAGTVTATGAGLTLTTTSIPTSAPSTDIKADLAPTFTSGTLTLRLGNLIKVITVTKRAAVGLNGAVNTDFATSNYVSGNLDDTTPTWFKLGKNNATPEPDNRVYNSAGGQWMHLAHNVGATNAARKSGAYITSLGDKGRARVEIHQAGAILKYISGVPICKLAGDTPAPSTITATTQLPGWTIKVKPVGYSGSTSWPAGYYKGGTTQDTGYCLPGTDNPSTDIGDPRRYYLGGTWRTPASAEYKALFDGVANSTSWPTASWNWQASPAGVKRTAAPALFFRASGYRDTSSGSFNYVAANGLYWSSSVDDSTDGLNLDFSSSWVYPQSTNYRSYGFSTV